jgi:hypothetical protein
LLDRNLLVMGRKVRDSTPTIGALLREVEEHLDTLYGPGEVPRPSTATAYAESARTVDGEQAMGEANRMAGSERYSRGHSAACPATFLLSGF